MPVETVDLAGAADEWCSVHVPSLACEGCIRAAVHVGQSCSAQHAQCIPNVQYLLHICRPLVRKPVFLGHGKAMASVLCRLSVRPSPWATPDPEQVSLLFACPTSKSPPAGGPRREGGALSVSILVASRGGGGAGSPRELLPGADVQVG